MLDSLFALLREPYGIFIIFGVAVFLTFIIPFLYNKWRTGALREECKPLVHISTARQRNL